MRTHPSHPPAYVPVRGLEPLSLADWKHISTKVPVVPRAPRFEKKASVFKGQKGKSRHKDLTSYLFTPFVNLQLACEHEFQASV